ncbi:hypothetical protein JTE90_018383 [Oedothorax gibbosus]|uniref:Uncharacterized protein n=1 Tax=Oedothorax gibbosus TaxID=931172 RepID=A0AAV6UC48_9ARAC|nr:hypothetical protein JTE90_018383 [Oedothorax gibbosus]
MTLDPFVPPWIRAWSVEWSSSRRKAMGRGEDAEIQFAETRMCPDILMRGRVEVSTGHHPLHTKEGRASAILGGGMPDGLTNGEGQTALE